MDRRKNWVTWGFISAWSLKMVGCGAPQSAPQVQPEPDEGSSELAATAEPLPAVVQKRSFVGPEGLRIDVVELEGNEALLVVSGVQSELTGLSFRYQKEQDGEYLRYRTPWHGRTLNTLVKSERTRGTATWRAYIPDASRDGFDVSYSEELSEKVDERSIIAAHLEQKENGSLEKISAFDRAAEEAGEMESLSKESARTSEECGQSVSLTVKWDTVGDDQILSKSVSGYCGSLLSGLRNVCRFEAGKRFVREHVKSASCRLDGSEELSNQEGAWTWAIGFDTFNLDQKAREKLLAWPTSAGRTLKDEVLAEQTTVCSDSTGKYVVMMGPEEAPHHGMAYGAGKSLYYVPVPKYLGEGWFLDPRQRNEKRNDNFRGYDLRVYSLVQADAEKGTCELLCGSREVKLQLLSGKAKADAMTGVQFQASPHGREPYALARDSFGTYYYVDRGNTQQTSRDFQLYRGKRGVVKPLKMKDVVSDSEGEIFASESGDLRLVLQEKGDVSEKPRKAQWISGRRTTQLVTLPLVDNYQLIYNELGVYLGEPLGLPCDDL